MSSSPTSGGVPALVLVSGPERVLADRAVDSTLTALRSVEPGVEVIRLDADAYEPGSLVQHASPSLFGGVKALVVRGIDAGTDELLADTLAVVAEVAAAPPGDLTLVVEHRGGARGKKVLDTLKKAGARVLEAPAIKTDREKSEFVTNEFRRRGRRIDPAAVRALVEAVGRDVSELAAACGQLADDSTGVVDADLVETYHGGRVEATGFKVAETALAGDTPAALRLLRHALAGGLDPVPIVAVIASQLRQLVKVSGAGRGPSGSLAKSLGMAPWQIDKARRLANGWTDDALGAAVQAVAAADFDVKGGGRDPVYALERAILTIGRARTGR
ncbi:DNA polymerase III subunit delta [Agilicoccus flavus]|uniref:DNA polymerase III subunit delta n=1 Tax=Agilicoccus flavus TaxID=2775968 RepID=UPI001CF6CC24|nr:DNA polymerase III subunit delta [Agilicoccus flavus]